MCGEVEGKEHANYWRVDVGCHQQNAGAGSQRLVPSMSSRHGYGGDALMSDQQGKFPKCARAPRPSPTACLVINAWSGRSGPCQLQGALRACIETLGSTHSCGRSLTTGASQQSRGAGAWSARAPAAADRQQRFCWGQCLCIKTNRYSACLDGTCTPTADEHQ